MVNLLGIFYQSLLGDGWIPSLTNLPRTRIRQEGEFDLYGQQPYAKVAGRQFR